MQHLQPNTTLQGGKYKIERVLGQGGFGITYLARNTVFDIDVAIKEFFMKDENDRDGSSVTMPNTTKQELFQGQMEKFKKEAKRMFAIKNNHVIGVSDLFEENGTAYYVMDYVDGENLAERLKRTGKPMTEQEVRDILPQILNALKSVHDAGIWHLDIKPANILIDKKCNVKLIDFGASKQLNIQKGGATTSTAISYTSGYAPLEQMDQNYDKFGPWTDIYALGATLYTLLTNKRPPHPTEILDDETCDKHEVLPFLNNVSEEMKLLVLWMMKPSRYQRAQNIDTIENYLIDNHDKSYLKKRSLSEDTIIESPRNVASNTSKIKKESSSNYHLRKKKKSVYIWSSVVIIAFLFIIGYYILQNDNVNKIRINEVFPSSRVDAQGKTVASVILENTSSSTCDINGLYLTSDRSCLDPSMSKEERVKRMYLLSSDGEGTKLEANGQITFYCNSNPSRGRNHLSLPLFALVPFWLAIYDKTASHVIDSVSVPALGDYQLYKRDDQPNGSSWKIHDVDVVTSATIQNK